MRKMILLLALVSFVGCGEVEPERPHLFRRGDKVKIVINGKPAVVVGVYGNYEYGIRYSNDLGTLEYNSVDEYELQKWEQ